MMKDKSKIIRTWKGWTNLENAPTYEDMLINKVFPSVKKRGVEGLEKVRISTAERNNEVEFLIVLQFESLEAVKQFAGEDYEKAFIPDYAKQVLTRYDDTAEHFILKAEFEL
jgi:hypothetical protein